jgi:hypothetical protein
MGLQWGSCQLCATLPELYRHRDERVQCLLKAEVRIEHPSGKSFLSCFGTRLQA